MPPKDRLLGASRHKYDVVEHRKIYKGKEFIISCDDNELNEALANLG